MFAWFKKKEVVEESEESRSKVRVRCEQGEWFLEVKEECGNGWYCWRVVERSDTRAGLDQPLDKWRNKLYYLHNGTVEYY